MRKDLFALFIFILLAGRSDLYSQGNLYSVDTIREIRINFTQPNWDELLDSFYVAGFEQRLTAKSIVIDGTTLDSVGVRYKGYSSVSVNRVKNPFNIKLNFIDPNQTYKGIDKIKLSNVIQDPSFVREVLSYEIARKYMPASEANYVNLYINDTLIGVYSNVQAVDKQFLQKNYHSTDGTFFKCNPASLDLFGENSNLSDSPGTDTTLYYNLYDLKSDFGWTDLYEFIDTLNNVSNEIDKVLNVDRALWMHAFNYALINFDSYIGYAQNYYLYKDNNGRFNPILWDLNQSFASYRLTDASIHFGGFNITEAKNMDPLLHHNNVSVYPRPLMRNLFANNRYRRMYLAHMRTIMDENFANQDYFSRAQLMQAVIDTSVQNDTNKFYSYADFQTNLTATVTDLVDYPGIKDLMDARTNFLSSYPGFPGAPTISNISSSPSTLNTGDSVWITCKVISADSVILAYRSNSTELFNKADMFDDGLHNDGAAGDSTYGYLINNIGAHVQYYIYAENDSAGRFSPERAEHEYHELLAGTDVVLNELCAINANIWPDPQGQFEDWIELYNNSSNPISLNGYFLSDDNMKLKKWQIPDTSIAANGFLIIWADNDILDSGLHAGFNLSAFGEAVYLSDPSGKIIDEVAFIPQSEGLATWARYPNGTGPWQTLYATLGSVNQTGGAGLDETNQTPGIEFIVYPNPAKNIFHLQVKTPGEYRLSLTNMYGQVVERQLTNETNTQLSMDIRTLASGVYFITLSNEYHATTKKIVIQ